MNAINANWILAGDAIFTVKVPAGFGDFAPHYTYRVRKVEMKASGKYPARTAWFVSNLTGPDNTADYTYLGEVLTNGEVKLTAKSAFPETAKRVKLLRRVLARVFAGEIAAIEAAGFAVNHEGFCGRCGALLTVPESVECGFGPECVKLVTGNTLKQYAAAMKCVAVATAA